MSNLFSTFCLSQVFFAAYVTVIPTFIHIVNLFQWATIIETKVNTVKAEIYYRWNSQVVILVGFWVNESYSLESLVFSFSTSRIVGYPIYQYPLTF